MGSGSSKRIGITLRAKGFKKAYVIFDKGMVDFGIAGPIIENLNMANIETVCFDKVTSDPPDEMVEACAEEARVAGCDVIVAIGDGSSMDTAKGVNVLINNPPPIRQYFGVQKNLRPGLPLVFVPTTSGFGILMALAFVLLEHGLGAVMGATPGVLTALFITVFVLIAGQFFFSSISGPISFVYFNSATILTLDIKGGLIQALVRFVILFLGTFVFIKVEHWLIHVVAPKKKAEK